MIDKKKISQAAIECADEYYSLDYGKDREETNREIFTRGAHWALQECKKSLWHDAEEPEKGKPCLLYGVFTKDDEEPIEDYFVSYFTTYGWTEDYFPEDYDYTIKRWCYIDDILPKGGGE